MVSDFKFAACPQPGFEIQGFAVRAFQLNVLECCVSVAGCRSWRVEITKSTWW